MDDPDSLIFQFLKTKEARGKYDTKGLIIGSILIGKGSFDSKVAALYKTMTRDAETISSD